MKMKLMTIGIDWEEKIVIMIDGVSIHPRKQLLELIQKELSAVEIPYEVSFEKLESVKFQLAHKIKNWK